jgi:hypothetical protein
LFPLPDTKIVETFTIKLDDGIVVERTADQLASLPSDQLPAAPIAPIA